MKWRHYWPECLLALVIAVLEGSKWLPNLNTQASSPIKNAGWSTQRKLAAREKTRELWYHGFDNYMTFAFPLDELTPLSCSGQGPDWSNPHNIASNDVAGNFSLTLIDVLDTLVVLDDRQGFETAVKNVIQWVSFDVNTKPQVFETTIRVLGGLLSGHIFANQTGQPFHLPWYRGELLDLAYDLGKRLLPAFSTPTGLPYARINLRHGLMKGETIETCSAGAGSLILEFATLSRLTGDDRFEKAAHRAFFGIWNRKSEIGLIGNTINIRTGDWIFPEATGIGAGIDSFYEYALKWYIMSGDVEFLDVWDDAYSAIMRYSRGVDGFWYRPVNMHTGDIAYNTVDSLSAFWPGLQVLAGDVQSAIKLHMSYYNLWREHAGLPEVYDTSHKKATSHQYPLRPEFIESTWYLYRATRDPFYLDVGERVLNDITMRCKVECGLTGIQDLRTNKRDDRMESFALSETLKYLYLLFDEENVLHSDDSNYVLTTEGHILTLGREHLKPVSATRNRLRGVDNHQCPAYKPFFSVYDNQEKNSGLVEGVRARPDVEYPRFLVNRSPTHHDTNAWSVYGWCEKPKFDLYSYDFILSANGKLVPEDLNPSLLKLGVLPDGFIINNVTGVRAHIVRRLDGKGYDISKLGHYAVRPGHTVYINDTTLFKSSAQDPREEMLKRDPDVELHFFTGEVDPMFQVQTGIPEEQLEEIVTAYTASFGADLSAHVEDDKRAQFSRSEGLVVYREPINPTGCKPYTHSYPNSVLVVQRGECTFMEKLLEAKAASAAGVVVISNESGAINPTANMDEVTAAGDLSGVGIVLITRDSGEALVRLLDQAEAHGAGRIMVMVNPGPHSSLDNTDTGHVPTEKDSRKEEKEKDPNSNRILYINGHPLLNTRLLV
ncbi:alpha mannosidase-like protein [Crucibulum laeve]|uniref:alpha-1,2-Mannosidase n=1 Tax=Crucibulum laeve TaxID=68775 RepID=A0A5C3MG40_9AGAR|nr:alpha mannosidase-like protein [Crucibulum laeve]